MILHWLDGMSVGVSALDEDHKRVIALLSAVVRALEAGEAGRAAGLSAELHAFAEEHTAREEAFLRRVGYPNTDKVIAIQRETLAAFSTLTATIARDPQTALAQAGEMMEAFIRYLLMGDINFKSHLEQCGYRDVE